MANKDKTTWVLVADEAIAHFLELPAHGGDLVPVEAMTDPDAHATNLELRGGALGRREGGQPSSHPGSGKPQGVEGNATMSAGPDESHKEAAQFAREVASRLAERLQQHRFDELRIAAAPRFLGLLRKAMSPQVAATVKQELDKDLIHASPAELTKRFMPPPPKEAFKIG